MKIGEIKRLAEQYTPAELQQAIQHYQQTETYPIEVAGENNGEKYTHLYGAIWVLKHMEDHGFDQRAALRAYGALLRF